MREECLAVHGECGAVPAPGEQGNTEEVLKGGDPLGHGLLGDAELVRRVLKLAVFSDEDEGAQDFGVHGGSISSNNHQLSIKRILCLFPA
ncbi:hypothetical protein Aple_013380 [Acrocarpospora pleiomorpha]|uniref:Uncharacterized protein n=1 Tax=Acrocarpospora pleiomorpha TaxID=90975 RepID=A0A5M3XHF7_9ACTN|nr:hypothetical protein Aple_013380 [Acrocarpospora pleiomorpha]